MLKHLLVTCLSALLLAGAGCEEAKQPSGATETQTAAATTDTSADRNVTGQSVTVAQEDVRAVDWKSMAAPDGIQESFFHDVTYGDYNCDGSEDALVRRASGNSIIHAYMYTYHGEQLTKIFEHTGLYQGYFEPGSAPCTFVELVSVHSEGDENCCPSNLNATTYQWFEASGSFQVIDQRIIPNPNR